MAVAGTLEVQLFANLARLQTDMTKTKGMVGNAMTSVERSVNMAKRALGALGIGLSAIVFTRLIKGALDSQDELAKLSQKLNISVEGLVGLQHAASLSGLQFEGLQKAIKTVSTQMFDASMGLLESKRNFSALGIEIKDTEGGLKSAEAVIIEVADKFAAMEDGTLKTALAVKLFGKAGLDMIPMLNEGSAALAKMVAEGQALNPVTAESARQAEVLNDSWKVLTKSFTRYGTTLLNDVLPVTSELVRMMSEEALAGAMKKSKEEAAGLNEQFKILPETIKVVTILAGNVSFVLQGIGREIGGIAAQLAALARGDFGGFSAIRDALVEDGKKARKELDEWEKRVMGLGAGVAAAGGGAARSAGGAGTGLTDAELKAQDKARQLLGDQFQWQLDEEQKMREEIDAIYIAAHEQRISDEQQRQADLMAAKIEGYEWEQQQAYEQGQALLQIDAAIAAQKAADRRKEEQAQAQFMGNLTGLMNTQSRELFEIGKIAAMSQAALDGAESVMSAYKWGTKIGGPWVGAAFAAAAGVATLNMINNIRSQQFGGGGSGVPISASQGASNISPVGAGGAAPSQGSGAGRGQTTIVNLYGNSYTRAQVRELLEAQNENSVDGSRTVVVER